MKNKNRTIEHVIVIIALTIFLIILFQCSTAGADTRRDRTLETPQGVIPNAKLRDNNSGGHDYYIKGKMVARSRKNINGSYDIYVKGRLKWKGAKFKNSPNTTFKESPKTHYVHKSKLITPHNNNSDNNNNRNTNRSIVTHTQFGKRTTGHTYSSYKDLKTGKTYYGSDRQIKGQYQAERDAAWRAKKRAESAAGK